MSGDTSQTQVTINQQPDYIADPTRALLGSVFGTYETDANGTITGFNQGLANQQWDPYSSTGNERIAGFDQSQIDAYDNITNTNNPAYQGLGGYKDYLNDANNSANVLSTYDSSVAGGINNIKNSAGYNTADISKGGKYFDPYQQNVIDSTMAEMGRQQNIGRMGQNAQATKMGAFGGSRQAVYNAELDKNFDQNRWSALSQLNSQGFQNAQRAQEAHLNRQYQVGMGLGKLAGQRATIGLDQAATQGKLAGQQQGQFLKGQSALEAVGKSRQDLYQTQLDFDYDQWNTGKTWDMGMAGWASDILHGAPSSESQITQSTNASPSSLAQGVGALGQFATMGNQLGWWGNKDG